MKNRSPTPPTPLVIRLVIAIAWFAAGPPSKAQTDPPYLSEMPTVERVRADVQGTDRHDTLARQKAAFEQLFRVVDVAAGPRRFSASGLTPGEQRWRDAYRGAADAARKEVLQEGRAARSRSDRGARASDLPGEHAAGLITSDSTRSRSVC